MLRDYLFAAKRGSWVGSDPVELLAVSMGTLRLITPTKQARQRYTVVSVATGVGLSALFALIFLLFRDAFGSVYVVILYFLVVAVVGIVVGVIGERWVLRFLGRHPQGQVDLTVRDVRLRRLFHDLRAAADGEEFLLKVQGLRRNVTDGLALAGFLVPPVLP
ncbi:MAG: hypothetical protein ACE5JE_06435 [Thermoplasmata archaeon]